jgi:hypothetical protein
METACVSTRHQGEHIMSRYRTFCAISLLAALALIFSSVSAAFAQSGVLDKPAPAPVVYRLNSDGSLTKETTPTHASYAPAPPPPAGLAPMVKLPAEAALSSGSITPLYLSSGYYYYYAWYYVGNAYTRQTIYFYQDVYGNQTVYWTQWDRSSGSSYTVQLMWLTNLRTGTDANSWTIYRTVNPSLFWSIQTFVGSAGSGSKLKTQFGQGFSTYYVELYIGN